MTCPRAQLYKFLFFCVTGGASQEVTCVLLFPSLREALLVFGLRKGREGGAEEVPLDDAQDVQLEPSAD